MLGPGAWVDFSALSDVSAHQPIPSTRTPTLFVVNLVDGTREELVGTGFVYGPTGWPGGGVITEIALYDGNALLTRYTGLSLPAPLFYGYLAGGQELGAARYAFAGDDVMTGGDYADVLRGFKGADVIDGGGGNDTIYGDEGDDLIDGGSGVDAAAYKRPLDGYVLTWIRTGAWTISDKTGIDGKDALSGIEAVQFTDHRLKLDTGSSAIDMASNNILRASAALSDVSIYVGNAVWTATQGSLN